MRLTIYVCLHQSSTYSYPCIIGYP